jgi:hypothetical protein
MSVKRGMLVAVALASGLVTGVLVAARDLSCPWTSPVFLS